MEKKLVAEHIDFADSEFKSLNLSEDDFLTIYMNSWDGKILKIVFSHTIQFFFKLGDVPKDLYEILDESSLNKALLSVYTSIPPNHSYKLFQIEDIEDFSFIEVLAQSVSVFKD